MAAVAELETSLDALRSLKAPGVTKSRIAGITTLCLEHVKSESVLVQKIYTAFKKSPSTHKLGVMYVLDAVVRQWIDKAKSSGQYATIESADDGTFAAGVRRIRELLPVLMQDLVHSAPDDQKDKIVKLLDIWERGEIFAAKVLTDYKNKLNARAPQTPVAPPADGTPDVSTTPQGNLQGQAQLLASLSAAQSQPTAQAHAPAMPNPTPSASSILSSLIQQASVPAPAPAPTPVIPQLQNGYAAPPPLQQPSTPSLTADQASALSAVIPPHIAANPEALNKHLQILQQLAEMRVPAEQWPMVIQALQDQQNGMAQGVAAPPQNSMPRARSRSPNGRRDSPVYGNYRQRSPLRTGSPSMGGDMISLYSAGPKWTDYDGTLPNDHIKVLSRTLFVGGVACGDDELRRIFSRFGRVQTCIANVEKRHAFVKMCTRAEALAARDGMQVIRDSDIFAKIRSVRWGVGFGPRDCSDYTTGVSIIPIDRLTDADRKWMLSAEYGGTGGKPIVPGLVVEEPDIEIGAGVSSKAISARRGADSRRNRNDNDNSPQRNNSNNNNNGNRRHEQRPSDSYSAPKPQQQYQQQQQQQFTMPTYPPAAMAAYGAPPGLGVPPAVPGFGFQFPGVAPPGMGGR